MSVNVTYPPLDVLKTVFDNVWIVDSGPLKAGGLIPLPVRMTVIRLHDGSLLLHSPTRFDHGLKQELEVIAPVRHVVAPNSAHWIFVKQWQQHMPDAITWAAPGLRQRSQVKKSGVRLDHDLGRATALWPEELQQVHVPGIGGFREVCLFHTPSRTLIMTDLVQNLEPEKFPLPIRPFAALAGVTAPDGKAPIYLREIVKAKGDIAKIAGRQLVALQPERVIFTHGRWFETDAAAQLKRSLHWLVR
jgi:hypothetical protein